MLILIGIGIYIIINIQIVKDIDSGKLHPCYICEKDYGASCMVVGKYFVWQEQPNVSKIKINLLNLSNP